MSSDCLKKLKENTTVMENMFLKNNLKVLNYTFHFWGEEDEGCELIVELASISGDKIFDDSCVKVNIYDSNGDIMLSENQYIFANAFSGYDTIKISIDNESQILSEAKSARIFLAR